MTRDEEFRTHLLNHEASCSQDHFLIQELIHAHDEMCQFELDPEDFVPETDHRILPYRSHRHHVERRNRHTNDEVEDLNVENLNVGLIFIHILMGCNIRWLQFNLHWHFQLG